MFYKYFLMILCALNIQRDQKCRLYTRSHFGEPLPVLLRDGQLLEPNDKFGNIDIEHGDSLTVSCEGSGFIRHPNVKRNMTTALIICGGGTNFFNEEWLNAPSHFSLFKCLYPPTYSSHRTNRTCFNRNRIIEVGYTVQNNFYPVYETCFDEDRRNPIYSKYTQKSYNAKYQTRVERPFFIANENYGFISVEKLFSPRGQKNAVARLVGPPVYNYFTKHELSRGHLAAKTDFVLAFGERATFHYVNCAPQWEKFNGGNWNTLEVDLRNHIHRVEYNTIIYTGTFGVTQLLNQYGQRIDIHLYTDENNNPIIPVPQYYYKVVYEPSTRRGIAFVGINNPYYTPDEAKELFFCNDLCRGNRNFNWLTWHPDNPSEGYTFCCSIPDFRDTVEHLPDFEVQGILT